MVELVIVISIMAIIMGLVVYGLKSGRKKGRMARAKSEMITLGHAVNAYHDAHKDDYDLNNQWPRSTYDSNASANHGLGVVPWELSEGGFWEKGKQLDSDLVYERFQCSPKYGDNFDEATQMAGSGSVVNFTDSTRQNACAATPDPVYVGVDWAGFNGVLTDSDEANMDNGFLLLYVKKPLDTGLTLPTDRKVIGQDNIKYYGKFLMKMGGTNEDCLDTSCQF